MAKDDNRVAQDSGPESRTGENEAREQEANAEAAKNGESIGPVDVAMAEREREVNELDPQEEAERQQAEAGALVAKPFEGHEEMESARQGFASTSRAHVGRVVVLHNDEEHEGELYKAGAADLPLEVADYFVGKGKAFEPAGKKRGR